MTESSVPKELVTLMEEMVVRHFERVSQTSSEDHKTLANEIAPEMARLVWERGDGERARSMSERQAECQVGLTQRSLAEELIREYRMSRTEGAPWFRTWIGRLWASVQETFGVSPLDSDSDVNATVGVRG